MLEEEGIVDEDEETEEDEEEDEEPSDVKEEGEDEGSLPDIGEESVEIVQETNKVGKTARLNKNLGFLYLMFY